MSDAAARLPARPSLEQLRKQAKEELQRLREENPAAKLADAQFRVARSYGFESWPRLVQHVGFVLSSDRLALFEQIATDLHAGYFGDEAALVRLGAWFGDSYTVAQRQERVRDRVDGLQRLGSEPSLDDVRLVVARQFGFDTWADLAESLAQPPARPGPGRADAHTPPFFRIDEVRRVMHPQPPVADRDWDVIFSVMEERGLTGIATSAMTNQAMERLADLDFVTALHIGGARQLNDDGLLSIARMPQLEEIDLSGWHSPITDRGLAALKHLPNLKRFSMCWPQRVSDAGVSHLAACDKLERVDLMGTPTGDGAIRALCGKPDLREFKTGRLVTDAGIPLLHEFPAFKRWQDASIRYGLMDFGAETNNLMLDGPFTDAGLAQLAGLDGVFGLNFFWHTPAFTSAGLAGLAALPNLRFLGCDGKRCDDEAMRHIAAIPRLHVLMAQGTVATDEGFVALSASSSIEYIWGRECPFLTNRGFVALRDMPALKGLAVSCLHVDDDGLAALPHFPALTDLLPMDVNDDGFRHVARCAKLEKLWCMYCRDTGDAATEHIAGLDLELYYAGKTRITDRSLQILGRMHSLEKIELWEIGAITDAGIAALATLPSLRELSIEGSPNVTRAGLNVLPRTVRVNQ
jgi:hypothetical protein